VAQSMVIDYRLIVDATLKASTAVRMYV